MAKVAYVAAVLLSFSRQRDGWTEMEGSGEKGEWKGGGFPSPNPLLLIFYISSQLCFLCVLFWKPLLPRLLQNLLHDFGEEIVSSLVICKKKTHSNANTETKTNDKCWHGILLSRFTEQVNKNTTFHAVKLLAHHSIFQRLCMITDWPKHQLRIHGCT